MEAIVLAGGLGTRLGSLTRENPKPMLDINGEPFLNYLLRDLQYSGVKKVVLSVGYRWEVIRNYYGTRFNSIDISYSVEDAPLGTGGAIKAAIEQTRMQDIVVLNGDTFTRVELPGYFKRHVQSRNKLSMVVKEVDDSSRYGGVVMDSGMKVRSFGEKQVKGKAWINVGIYILNRSLLTSMPRMTHFSFEKDFLEKSLNQIDVIGMPYEGYFLDIGVSEDYARAQKELSSTSKYMGSRAFHENT